MPMDKGDVLYFEAAVLDDEELSWDAQKIGAVIDALGEAGLVPEGEIDPMQWAATSRKPCRFRGATGRYRLVVKDSGGWRWDTPASTLMQTRFRNRPEAVAELIDAVRAVIGVATPYYGCTWRKVQQHPPWWMRTHHPFAALDGRALQFFSVRYLDVHNGGQPFSDPPCVSESLAGGQLLIGKLPAFGEADGAALLELADYLQPKFD
ncbi:hypothetical protein [Streptomyces milbemycinicus]|uniref:Uncharacterized protein n=1 Tax=Streptomyces milbemycinicus TaxID=476552 RepID=A0ABW8LFV0_9ACTN